MQTNYSNTSNYAKTTLNNKYLEFYNPPLTQDSLSEKTITMILQPKYDRRPDLLANDLYGSSRLWWVFVHYNRDLIKDPIMDFKAGIKLIAPKTFKPSGVN